MSFVSTGSFMNRATLTYVTAGHFTIRHKILINKTSKPNNTSVLNFNMKIIKKKILQKTIIIWSRVLLKVILKFARRRDKARN